jgi:hypothetical protein
MRADGHHPFLERTARIVTVVACVWFAFAAAWGMCQIPGGGHTDSGSVGVTGAALSIVRFHTLYPSTDWYTVTPPPPATYYCHHPFGVFYCTAFFLWIFGHQDFVVRLSPILMSIAIPPLLYGIGKRYGGHAAMGAVAACAYAVVPIAIGFANFNNLETPAIFGSLLFFWGHTAHQATGKRRYLAASLAGQAVVCSADWVGYLLVAPLLGWGLLRAFVLPSRWTPRFAFRPYARWWALSTAIAVGTFVLWIGLFIKADKIGDWIGSAEVRASDGTSLWTALEARKNWIDFSFTPLAIALGKVALPICLLRALVIRRDEEFYSLSVLVGSVVQYVAFKRGADVHIFWPHYFAEYYALALAQLAGTLGAIGRWTSRRFLEDSRASTIGAWTTLALGLLPSIAMAPDAVRSLPIWRRTGGRYDDNGSITRNDIDLLYVVKKVIVPRKPPGSTIEVNPSSGWWWEHSWTFDGPSDRAGDPTPGQPAASNRAFWLGRASGLSADDQRRIASRAHVEVYGDTWVVDQRMGPAPIDAWTVEEGNPNPIEWLRYGDWEPMRRIGPAPDPLRTWEWRVHMNQPATLPASEDAHSIDDLRILHNAAIYDHAADRAERLREKIDAQLDRTVLARFDQGIEIVGVRVTKGAQPKLEVWFLASGPTPADAAFHVRSTIERPARLSLVPADTVDREMASPPTLPTKIWRPGFIYKLDVVLNHRIGVERYWGAWSGSSPPRRLDGQPETTLVVVY